MARRVYMLPRFVQYVEDYFKENNVEMITGPQDNLDDLMNNALECEAVMVALGPICREYMEANKNLKVAAKLGVGVDNIDCKAAEELGIWAGFAPQSNSLSVAEFTITAICNMSRKYSRFTEATFKNNWQNRLPELIGQEMEGKTIGIVGLGRIGSIVAKKAYYGLDMKVLGYRKNKNKDDMPEYIEMVDDFDELLARSDYITVHAPLSDDTREMFNMDAFKKMKNTALFINTSRGPLMNEKDLYDALVSGEIAGATIDTFCVEPPDMSNPLFTLSNVYPTPHKASHTIDAQRRMAEHAAMNIVAVLDGREPVWPVNHPKNPRS